MKIKKEMEKRALNILEIKKSKCNFSLSKFTANLEIILLILSIFSFAYILSEELEIVNAQEPADSTGSSTPQAINPEIRERLDSQQVHDSVNRAFGTGTTQAWDLVEALVGDHPFYQQLMQIGRSVIGRALTPDQVKTDYEMGCCEKMTSGAICQNIPAMKRGECATGWMGGHDCEKGINTPSGGGVEPCTLGCCISLEKGTCEVRSTKNKCEEQGGPTKSKWVGENEGNDECTGPGTDECQIGCCVAGENAYWAGKLECDKIAEFKGLNKTEYEFKDVGNEGECLLLSRSQARGACLMRDETGNADCAMKAKVQCATEGFEFHEGRLCTDVELYTKPDGTRIEPKDASCKPTNQTTCVEGKDEVYFLDSCKNILNIYNADMMLANPEDIFGSGTPEIKEYWSKIIEKNDSCGAKTKIPGSALAGTCGNCDFAFSSKCYKARTGKDAKPKYGENVCRDLDCYNVPYYTELTNTTVNKKHGESWCIYDGWVGDPLAGITGGLSSMFGGGSMPTFQFGKDVVGSRHWKYYCEEGEIKNDSCYDYREGICQESNQDSPSRERSTAQCVPNRWRECLMANQEGGDSLPGLSQASGALGVLNNPALNSIIPGLSSLFSQVSGMIPGLDGILGNMQTKCLSNSQCMIKNVNIDEFFKFDMCVPKYPPGFELTGEGAKAGEEICDAASRTGENACQVVYVKDITGWECVANCKCEEPGFVVQMNELCISLGDCGAKVNIEGMGSDSGYRAWEEPGGNKWMPLSFMYSLFAIPIPGYKIPLSKDIEEDASSGGEVDDTNMMNEVAAQLGAGSGGGNQLDPAKVTNFRSKVLKSTAGAAGVGVVVGGGIGAIPAVAGTMGLTSLGGFAAGAISGLVGAAIGGLAAVAFNLPPGASYVAMGTGFAGGLVGGIFFGPLGAILGGVLGGAGGAGLLKIFGMGEVEIRKMNFECSVWKQPFGGDCNECAKGSMKQCTKYRCESLGSACDFVVNPDGSGEGFCEKAVNDGKAPVIFPDRGRFAPEYQINERADKKGFSMTYNDGDFPAYSNVNIYLNTSEKAICKWGFADMFQGASGNTQTEKFNNWNAYAYDTGFSKDHLINFKLPPPASQVAIEEWTAMTDEQRASLESRGIDQNVVLQRMIQESKLTIYVRCADGGGNVNSDAYLIEFGVKPEPDVTAPIILKFYPASGVRKPVGTTEIPITFDVDKSAECMWSKVDQDYILMENSASCSSGVSPVVCQTKLTELESGENNFYFRCKNAGEGGLTNSQSQPFGGSYKVIVSPAGLNIYEVVPVPGASFSYGGPGITSKKIILEVKTEGGSEDGKSTCKYDLGRGSGDQFPESDKAHMAEINIGKGNYKVNFSCWDSAGNTAVNNTKFTVNLDKEVPQVTRAYYEGNLKIVTSEEAWCYASIDAGKVCNFDAENEGQAMSFDITKTIHSVEFNTEKTYYIMCRDQYQNWPAGCSIIIRPSDITLV